MKKMHPTPEMVNDLRKVFDKHNWSGQPIGLATKPVNLQAVASADGGTCPDGSQPQWVSYQLPDGTWAQKKICPGNS
jgi:hypothetical protein